MLKAISKHPVIAKHVTELVYKFSKFDEMVLTGDFRSDYSEQLRKQLDRHEYGHVELDGKELATSYERYFQYCREQQNSIETGSPMTCLAVALPLLPQLQHFRVVAGWKYWTWDQERPSGRSWDIMGLTYGTQPNIERPWYRVP